MVVRWLQDSPDFSDIRPSALVTTRPIGGAFQQPVFQNAVIAVKTGLTPGEIVERLLEVETRHGRKRGQRWDARTIDLDLMLYDQQVIRTEQCEVPHPRMTFRRFMLEPAVEVAADSVHPICQMTLRELLEQIDSTQPMVASTVSLPETLKAIIAEAGYQINESSWNNGQQVGCVTNMAQRPRLILIDSANEDGANDNSAQGIPGPYLELGNVLPDRLAIEVRAALDAMEPLS